MAAAPRDRYRRRPWLPLLNAIVQLAGDEVELLRHEETPWSSITFAGSRHTVALSFGGIDAIEAGEAFIAALPGHEFAIPGQQVVSATIVSADHGLVPAPRLTVEAEILLLEGA